MDWTSEVVRYTYTGFIESAAGELVTQRLDAMLRVNKSFSMLHDTWDVSGLDSGFRISVPEWSKQHEGAISSVQALARSKVVNMALITWDLGALQGRVNIYAKRAEFDLLCKKAGLPINVSMPQLASGASAAASGI